MTQLIYLPRDFTASAMGVEQVQSAIEAEINQWRPQALIVGIPYLTDGSDTAMTAASTLEKRNPGGE